MVPCGFVLQRVNQATVEIECAVTQLAGRLWSSFAPQNLSVNEVLEQRERAYTPTESIEDERVSSARALLRRRLLTLPRVQIQLSLAGLIPGSVKNVGALAMHLDRDATIATCQETARSLLRNYIRLQWNEEHGIIDDDANSAAAGSKSSPAKGRKRKSLASAAEGSASPASANMHPISGHVGAHATPTAKKARKSAASAASPATNTPAGRGTAGPSKGAAAARGASPPLPPGWIKKTSRSDPNKFYFANPVLKKVCLERTLDVQSGGADVRGPKTSWDRPTESE